MMPEAGQSSARPERSTSSGGRSERELVLVGGGLQSALIALAVLHARPDAAITVVEREERFGGNHTWCFHAADVPAAWQSVVEPLVEVRWPDYEVRFPGVRRPTPTRASAPRPPSCTPIARSSQVARSSRRGWWSTRADPSTTSTRRAAGSRSSSASSCAWNVPTA
jgi:hypothetical protein